MKDAAVAVAALDEDEIDKVLELSAKYVPLRRKRACRRSSPYGMPAKCSKKKLAKLAERPRTPVLIDAKRNELILRKAMLPYLDDFISTNIGLSNVERPLGRECVVEYAEPLWDKMITTARQSPNVEETVDESRGILETTIERRRVLEIPSDSEVLHRCAGELHRTFESTVVRDEAMKFGILGNEDSFTQFPRFCELTRVDDGQFNRQNFRGPTWLLTTIEEVYDALATAYGTGRPKQIAKGITSRAPDIVSSFFWRRFGSLAPANASALIQELSRACTGECLDALLFKSFLNETYDEEPLAIVLCARDYLETVYSLSLRRVSQRVITGADGRFGRQGTLPRKEEAPMLVKHSFFSSKVLRDAKSPLFDPHILSVLLPRAATARLARFLIGGRREIETAFRDELGARGLSALSSRAIRASRHDRASPEELARVLLAKLENGFFQNFGRNLFSALPNGAIPAFPLVADGDDRLRRREFARNEDILQALANLTSSAPDDLINFVKYNDNGERFEMVEALQQTLTDAAVSERLCQSLKGAETEIDTATKKLHQARARLERLQRQAFSTTSAKTKVVLAQSELKRAEAVRVERHSRLEAVENRIDLAWKSMLESSSTYEVETLYGAMGSTRIHCALRILRSFVARESIKRSFDKTSALEKTKRQLSQECAPVKGSVLEATPPLLGGWFDEEPYAIDDNNTALLEPFVLLQNNSAERIQKRVRDMLLVKSARRSLKALRTDVRDNSWAQSATAERRTAKVDQEVTASRHVTKIARLRKFEREVVECKARAEEILIQSLREKEVARLVACKERESMRLHLSAWSKLGRAQRYALRLSGALVRTTLLSWHKQVRRRKYERRCAKILQRAFRQFVSRIKMQRKRLLEKRTMNAAIACYGHASQRRLHRILSEWRRWTALNVKSKSMALAFHARYAKKILGRWYAWTKIERSRRHWIAELVKNSVHSALGLLASESREQQRRVAASLFATKWCRHHFLCFIHDSKAEIEQKARDLQRANAAISLRSKVTHRRTRRVIRHWRHSTRQCTIARAHDRKRILRSTIQMWKESTREQIVEHAKHVASHASVLCSIVRAFVLRRRLKRLNRPYWAARAIQTSIARPLLASIRVSLARELHIAALFTQRWRRGSLGRRRARNENAKQLFIAAYVDDSDALIRRHTAAITVHSLASTRATIAKHAAAGDLAIHRAARGVSFDALQACLRTLGIEANALNSDDCSPLHVIGEVLDPPLAALQEIAEQKRRRQDEFDLFVKAEKSLLSSSTPEMLTAEESALTYSNETIPGRSVRTEDVENEAPPLVTSELFQEWFEDGIPTKANVLHVLGAIHHQSQDETGSQAFSISSETSERELELAMMTNSELNDFISDDKSEKIVDLLLDHGANLEAPDELGRTPLLRAIGRGRFELVKVLLDRGARTDAIDFAGNTPLTIAAQRGYLSIGRLLLRSGADPSRRGRKGRTAMHEVCRLAHRTFASRFARSLLASGAPLDTADEAGWTPFAYCVSCRYQQKQNANELQRQMDGEISGAPQQLMLQLLLESGVDSGETYADGSTALHVAARANRVDAVSAIIDYGDVDVSAKDAYGETALHIAARSGAPHTLKALLRRGSNLYACDNNGNQPIHAACLGGYLEAIELLVAYDAPLGCRNWEGLTPLGVARMNSKHKVIQYLLNTISSSSLGIVDDESESTDLIASWSQPIVSAASLWKQEWSGAEGLSTSRWIHQVTGECRTDPPPDRASRVVELSRKAWPKTVLKRELVVFKEEDAELTVGSAEYEKERSEHELHVLRLRKEHDAAIAMQTRWRRLDAINLAAWRRARRDAARKIQRWMRWNLTETARLVDETKLRGVVLIQALSRGHDARRDFAGFLWERLWWRRAERILAKMLQRLWRGHVTRRFLKRVHLRTTGPKSYAEWQNVLRANNMKPLRVFGIFEERHFPIQRSSFDRGGNRDIKFYHNRITGVCSWDQPDDWIARDREAFEEREQLRLLGFTKREADAAARLQAIWKGRKERQNLHATLLGARLMRRCEKEYLENPRDLRKMAHYLLYLHVIQEDVERARPLYQHAIQQMRRRGPDDAWLLCSYAVFLAATGEEDWNTIVGLAEKGRKAREGPDGDGDRESFDVAKGGFFRAATAQNPKSGWAWHNYALILHLVYGDLPGAEENYVRAVFADSRNTLIQRNFSRLLEDRGSTLTCYDVIRRYSTNEMLRDAAIVKRQLDAMIQDPRMQEMALRVQMVWRRREFRRLVSNRAGVLKGQESDCDVSSKISDAAAGPDGEERSLETVAELGFVRRWEICETSDGRNFFYDTTRGVSQWQEPENVDEIV